MANVNVIEESVEPTSTIFVFDNPRTCSQLFHAFFKNHPQLVGPTNSTAHWGVTAATAGPERLQLKLKQGDSAVEADKVLHQQHKVFFNDLLQIDLNHVTYAASAQGLNDKVCAAQKMGLLSFVKEHITCSVQHEILLELLREGSVMNAPKNPTYIPDDIFFAMRHPVFLVRHPALVIPSFWRTQQPYFAHGINDEAMTVWTMQRAARFLFDVVHWAEPIVIDADDVIHRSEALCSALCKIWGIDASGVQYRWDVASPEERMHPLHAFQAGIHDSTGVLKKSEQKEVEIDVEYARWQEEFGDSIAEHLRAKVDADMTDYEYMQQFRLPL